MADRPYLTSAEAATYCGFKTIGGIQQAGLDEQFAQQRGRVGFQIQAVQFHHGFAGLL